MGIYVYVELIHFVIQQKLTHHKITSIKMLKKKLWQSIQSTTGPHNYLLAE